MIGYIISNKKNINIDEHEIKSFNVLYEEPYNNTLNIYVIENNKILYINNIIHNAVLHNHIKVLEWLINSKFDFSFHYILIYAAEYGKFKILNWIEKSDIVITNENIISAIEFACIKDRIDVFDWFKNSRYGFQCDESIFNNISLYGSIKTLEWLKKNNYKIKYRTYDIENIDYEKIFKFFCDNVNIKKAIIWNENFKVKKKFKTKNNYLKGYNKN
jgi:hypothetical protein